jgi:multiple sugar transport system ATP-binding protein
MNLIPATWHEQEGQVLVTIDHAACQVSPDTAARLRRIGSREVLLGIRPEHVHFAPAQAAQAMAGTVSAVEPLGRETLFHMRTACRDLLLLSAERPYAAGETVGVRLDTERLHVFKREEEA